MWLRVKSLSNRRQQQNLTSHEEHAAEKDIFALNFLFPCITYLMQLPLFIRLRESQHTSQYWERRLRSRLREEELPFPDIELYNPGENVPGILPCILILVGLCFIPESPKMAGINGISFYSNETFVAAGFSSGKIGTIAYAIIQVPVTVLGATLMDKSGRKPLLMVSTAGTSIGCIMTGASFFLKEHSLFVELIPILAVSGVLVYISAFSVGTGPVPWPVAQIFCHELAVMCSTCGMAFNPQPVLPVLTGRPNQINITGRPD